MIGKGLDPGSALVFMLTGPATDASTIAVVARMFGRRFVASTSARSSVSPSGRVWS